MDIGKALGESFNYAVEAVWGKWVRWILLIVCSIIFPLIIGYQMQVFRGIKPAPELANWGKLFIDGIKLLLVTIVYMIPFLLVFGLTVGAAIFTAVTSGTLSPAMLTGLGVGLIISLIILILTALFLYIAEVRVARTNSMGSAFQIGEILAHIGRIGWGSYILSLIVLVLVMLVLGGIVIALSMIPFIGWLIQLFLMVPLMLLSSRYICQLYDSAGTP